MEFEYIVCISEQLNKRGCKCKTIYACILVITRRQDFRVLSRKGRGTKQHMNIMEGKACQDLNEVTDMLSISI